MSKIPFSPALVWCAVMTSGCGFDHELTLQTTESVAVGGGGSGGESPVPTVDFCKLMFGRSWAGTSDEVLSSGKSAYATGLDMVSIWIGYEENDALNESTQKMFYSLLPGGDEALQGVVPVLYGYIIPFKARTWDGLTDCYPTSTTANVCTTGAAWISEHWEELKTTYANYATQVANIWGNDRPVIWLFEPDYSDYIRESQTEPLTAEEHGRLASELIGIIKTKLSNAIVSHFISPDITDYDAYFEYFDLSLVDMVNVTGSAMYPYFFSPKSSVNVNATYSGLSAATGLPIFVDTGFDASAIANNGWLTESDYVINQRIMDGVVAVQTDSLLNLMQARIDARGALSTPASCIAE